MTLCEFCRGKLLSSTGCAQHCGRGQQVRFCFKLFFSRLGAVGPDELPFDSIELAPRIVFSLPMV